MIHSGSQRSVTEVIASEAKQSRPGSEIATAFATLRSAYSAEVAFGYEGWKPRCVARAASQ